MVSRFYSLPSTKYSLPIGSHPHSKGLVAPGLCKSFRAGQSCELDSKKDSPTPPEAC